MCYLGVIEVYFSLLRAWFVGSVNTDIHIINLILYIFCGYLIEINVFFWWGEPRVPVDEDKGQNNVYWKPCTMSIVIYTRKGKLPLILSLRGRYWKMMVENRTTLRNEVGATCNMWAHLHFKWLPLQIMYYRRPWIMTQSYL